MAARLIGALPAARIAAFVFAGNGRAGLPARAFPRTALEPVRRAGCRTAAGGAVQAG